MLIEERNKNILSLHRNGFNNMEIALRVGITRERVRQILNKTGEYVSIKINAALKDRDKGHDSKKLSFAEIKKYFKSQGQKCKQSGCPKTSIGSDVCPSHRFRVSKNPKYKTNVPMEVKKQFPTLEQFKLTLSKKKANIC